MAQDPYASLGTVVSGPQPVAQPRQQAAPRRQQPQRPRVQFADDRDAGIRTLIGEADGQPEVGVQAVAGVIRNRAASRNQSVRDVVTAPYQFEPWGTSESAQRLMAIQPNDPRYIRAAAAWDSGIDPTGGADHFYAPGLQAKLGRDRPNFDNGRGRQIGDHLFFDLEGGGAQPAQAPARDQGADPYASLGAVVESVAPASTVTNIRAPNLGDALKGDAWAPWLTRPGRAAPPLPAPEFDAQGREVAVVDRPGIVQRGNGEYEIYDAATEAYYPANETEVSMYRRRLAGDLQDRREEEARRDDSAYQAQYETARAKAENIPPWLANLTVGGTLGGVQEILALNAGLRGEGSQAARDAFKDRQDTLLAEDPTGTIGMQLAGGLLTPGLKGSGDFIAGASGAARTGRAAVVSGAYGGAASVLGGDGNLVERLQRAPLDIGVSAATGGILDSALVGATARSAASQGQPAASAARRLSRRGVDLTPGQMASEIPVVGDVAKYTEDIIGGFNPMMGGVRRNQNEQVIRAAGQEALDTIRAVAPDPSVATLPQNARTGYQVSQNVMRVLGNEYDDVLGQVTGQADETVYANLDDMLNRAGEVLDDSRFSRLQRILDQNIFSRFEESGQLSGEQFKRIETTLRQQSERANRPTSTLEDVDLSEFLDETRDIVRGLISRQHPEQADRIQAINRGYAIAKRIQRATSGSAQMARQGTPLPGELTQTVAQMSNDAALSNQNGLLQELASDARTVLPASVGDTGSGQRAVIGGGIGLLATGGAAVVNPSLAAGMATGAVIYSPWGIQAVNLIYKATDPQIRNQLMSELYRAAARNPALQPYYQAAVEGAQSGAGNQSQGPAPATSSPPAPIPQGMAAQ